MEKEIKKLVKDLINSLPNISVISLSIKAEYIDMDDAFTSDNELNVKYATQNYNKDNNNHGDMP